jgi:hypothetical protein
MYIRILLNSLVRHATLLLVMRRVHRQVGQWQHIARLIWSGVVNNDYRHPHVYSLLEKVHAAIDDHCNHKRLLIRSRSAIARASAAMRRPHIPATAG